MSTAVSPNREESPSEWLLERFEEVKEQPWNWTVEDPREIIQLIPDHWDNCAVCRVLHVGEKDSGFAPGKTMRWSPVRNSLLP